MTALDDFRATAARESELMRKRDGQGTLGVNKAHFCPVVAERRAKVAELKERGLTLVQIADALGVNVSTVKSDSVKMAR